MEKIPGYVAFAFILGILTYLIFGVEEDLSIDKKFFLVFLLSICVGVITATMFKIPEPKTSTPESTAANLMGGMMGNFRLKGGLRGMALTFIIGFFGYMYPQEGIQWLHENFGSKSEQIAKDIEADETASIPPNSETETANSTEDFEPTEAEVISPPANTSATGSNETASSSIPPNNDKGNAAEALTDAEIYENIFSGNKNSGY